MYFLSQAGNLPPLPVTAFDGSNLEEAFRYMAAAKHIGRIAVKLSDENVQVTPRCPICTDRSYLVTGGVRGFGFAVAERLVQLGARHLWLVGRGGQGGNIVIYFSLLHILILPNRNSICSTRTRTKNKQNARVWYFSSRGWM